MENKTDNRLIAEFMQERRALNVYEDLKFRPSDDTKYVHYHDDWSWLMPVVEKIASLMPDIKMPDDLEALKNGTHGSEQHIEVISLSISSKITEVHEAVVKFIVWYNSTSR